MAVAMIPTSIRTEVGPTAGVRARPPAARLRRAGRVDRALARAAEARRRSEVRARCRRRRLTAVALALGTLVAIGQAGTALGGPSLATPEGGPSTAVPTRAVTHVVEPGETLWSIAADLAPGTDPRTVVDELVAARGGSADLVPGEAITWMPQ